MVELRTIAWADPASDVGMPGLQISGGWKCALVNYCHMCLLLVIAKESRLLYTGPAGPLLRARRASYAKVKNLAKGQCRVVHHLLCSAVIQLS